MIKLHTEKDYKGSWRHDLIYFWSRMDDIYSY